ncbi:hypothetical protein BRADI_1g39944v3 [Brachypodium distachyon]|uniref:Uncharacterized protein n=1 Tax=Brachypodium distachyon TaxID=15368 RepID=A0A2K2DNM5_BRADI|nr:hypothetical protein BRADI_1g39944v3 [Brachypodium distachyon]
MYLCTKGKKKSKRYCVLTSSTEHESYSFT